MKYKKNVISNLVFHILSIIISFVISVIVARSLGAKNQGVFSYILLIFGLLSSYGHIGITNSNGFFIKKSSFSKSEVVNTNMCLLIFLSIIYSIIILFFKNEIFESNFYLFSIIWIVYTISILFSNYLTTLYVIDENIYLMNRFLIVSSIVKGIIVVILFLCNEISILSISIVYSLAELVKVLFFLFNLKVKHKFYISFEILKKEFKYGMPLFLATLLIYLNYRADLFMVKNMLGDTDLGIYSIAVHLAELAFIIPTAFTTAFEGRLYGCDDDNRKKVTTQTINITFYITLIVCFIGILCKPLVGVIYGDEYIGAGISMVYLLIGIVFASIGKIAPVYFYTMGKPNIHLVVSFLVLIVNIVFNYFLIPVYGINGAAIASTISYIFYGLVYIFMLKKNGVNIGEIFRIKKSYFKLLKQQLIFRNKKI